MTNQMNIDEIIEQEIIKTGIVKIVKNEEFIISNKYDIEVVYRKKDMYFNAGMLCRSQGKRHIKFV